jgi:hypothetical protein
MSYEFLSHSLGHTSLDTLRAIKKDGGLRVPDDIEDDYDDSIKPKPFVYCHYLFSELDYKPGSSASLNYHGFSGGISFWIDPKILQDLPFYVCPSTMYGYCIENKEDILLSGKGKRKRMPSLEKLRRHINQKMQKNRERKKYNGMLDFTLSHEILLKKIPLRYVFAITVRRDKDIEKVRSVFPEIPVVLVNIDVPSYDKRIRKALLALSENVN